MRRGTRNLLIATLILVATGALLAHLYRDAIARRVANAALADLDMEVSAVSIDAIDTREVRFESLELIQGAGGRIRVTDFALPLDGDPGKNNGFHIGTIEVVPATNAAPTLFADLLQTIISAPDSAPHNSYRIERLAVAHQPPVSDIVWTPAESGQKFAFSIAGYRFAIDVLRLSERHHSIMVHARRPDTNEPLIVTLQLFETAAGFSISAEGNFRVAPLLPTLHETGIVPQAVTKLVGTLVGPVYVELTRVASHQLQLNATMTAPKPFDLTYGVADDRDIDVRASLPQAISVQFGYPSMSWSATTPQADVLIRSRTITGLPASLLNVSCESGIRCLWTAEVETEDFTFDKWRFGSARITSHMQAAIGETVDVSISAASAMSARDVAFGDYLIDAMILKEMASATFTVANGEWQATLPATTIGLQALRPVDPLVLSFDLQLTNTRLRDDGTRLASEFRIDPATTTIEYRNLDIAAPAAAGTFETEKLRQAATIRLSSVDQAMRAEVAYSQVDADSELHVRNAHFDLERRSLSAWLGRRSDEWDVIAGRATADLTLRWQEQGERSIYGGDVAVSAEGLAGNFDDLVFAGLDLSFDASIADDLSLVVKPVAIELGLLDAGVPLESLTANITPDAAANRVQVEALTFDILGGHMRARPFVWHRDGRPGEILFEVDAVQPALMVAMANFDSVEMDGSLSGELPLLLAGTQVIIDGGRLDSDPPGGVIRYRPDLPAEGMNDDSSQLGTVTRALGNFRYDTLSCDVNYAENGDLNLQMRIEGVNPDMDPNQPVILNLGLDNNVPQLLRSLQATRSIEDILERRASQ